MGSTWIAKNPILNIRNQSLAVPIADYDFEDLMRTIIHVCGLIFSYLPPLFISYSKFYTFFKDSGDYEAKLEILLKAKGFFNSEQVNEYTFKCF